MLGSAVAELISACERVDGGAVGASVEHVLDDWREVDLEALRETHIVGIRLEDPPPPGWPKGWGFGPSSPDGRTVFAGLKMLSETRGDDRAATLNGSSGLRRT